jgi:short-subunit dehydrogenase
MDVTGKVIIVTGASEGIGCAAARRLAQAGAKVALVARNRARLEELAQELRGADHEALGVPTDLRDPQAVAQMVEQVQGAFGRIDVLINNAGQSAAGTVADVDPAIFRQIMELNIYGALSAIQAVVPVMRAGGGGMIVNISSMVSKMNIPGLGTYAATKAALNVLSSTARAELAPENIRVITVFPRTTETDFGKHALGDREMRAHQRPGANWRANVVVDSPEFVAEKILAAVQTEAEETYMDR